MPAISPIANADVPSHWEPTPRPRWEDDTQGSFESVPIVVVFVFAGVLLSIVVRGALLCLGILVGEDCNPVNHVGIRR